MWALEKAKRFYLLFLKNNTFLIMFFNSVLDLTFKTGRWGEASSIINPNYVHLLHLLLYIKNDFFFIHRFRLLNWTGGSLKAETILPKSKKKFTEGIRSDALKTMDISCYKFSRDNPPLNKTVSLINWAFRNTNAYTNI